MPIPIECPHCGMRITMPDRYAGQTESCSACGKPVTIKARGKSRGTWIFLGLVAVVVVLLCGGMMTDFTRTQRAIRAAGRNGASQNNLSQLGISLANYRMKQGKQPNFPPAYVADASGKPLYSWRVLILPYIHRQDLYDKFDKTKAWDSPENKAISGTVLEEFHNPNEQSAGTSLTDYVTVVGKETAFVPPPLEPISRISDGEAYTVIVVEIAHSKIHWAEPVDLDFNTMSMQIIDPNGNCISSSYRHGANVLFADGHVKTLDQDFDPKFVRALLTRDGAEVLSPGDIY